MSPSGRAIIKLELTAKIYIVYGLTKLACIGAKNKSDALDHFIENVEEDYHRVDEMTNQEMQESQFLFDPNQRGIEEEYISVSGMEFITSVSAEDLPSLVLLLDNEDMINYFDNKRKNEDES